MKQWYVLYVSLYSYAKISLKIIQRCYFAHANAQHILQIDMNSMRSLICGNYMSYGLAYKK